MSSLRSIFLILFSIIYTTFSHAAVFQEPVDGQPDKYQSQFLFDQNFNEKIIPGNAALFLPALNASVPEASSGQLQSSVSPSPTAGDIRIMASYQKITRESLDNIIQTYKSIPGGITLEGMAQGLPTLNAVQYDANKNTFLLNGSLAYENPISKSEMKSILQAIASDDRMGVSLGDQDIIYGGLVPGSIPTVYMKLADHFLGCIIFANERWVAFNKFLGGYKPKANTQTGGCYAVYFNFNEFNFEIKDNVIKPVNSHLGIMIIPLTGQKDGLGGYLPDYDKVAVGAVPQVYEENIAHIVNNMSNYQNETRIQKINHYGEAAAFARALKNGNASLDKLIETM